MKTITIHCDYCTLQLFYENSTLRKKSDIRTVYHVDLSLTKNGIGQQISGDFCSLDCFISKIEDQFGSSPIQEDVLKAMADSLGYELKRKTQPKTKEEEEK